MDVKLLLLMNCVIVVNCQSRPRTTVSNSNDVSCDIKSKIESIRQQLLNLQQETRSGIEEIRQILNQQCWSRNQQKKTVALCSSSSCKNGGTCNPAGSTYTCTCPAGFIGQKCETTSTFSPCSSSPCKNGGTCKPAGSTYTCTCSAGFTGQRCETSKCPVGFEFLQEAGRCFRFVFDAMSWDNATERCRGILPGAHLAAITSLEENDAVVRYLKSEFQKNNIGSSLLPYENQYSHGVWTSGQRRYRGRCDNPFVWKTLNGIEKPFNFTNWARREPSCGNEREPCVHIVPRLSHTWNDGACRRLYYPLCEI